MPRILRLLSVILAVGATLGAAPVRAEIKVVASFSILADMVREVGGDKVSVTSLVGLGGDAHAYQPKPADAKAVAGAALVVVNGLGFETWLDRLVKSSGYKGPVAVASKGVETIEPGMDAHGHKHGSSHKKPGKALDPHAWQDLGRGQIYVRNIAQALAAADPVNAAAYAANGERYAARLAELDRWVKAELGAIRAEKRKVITSHDAFGYFAAAYGVTFLAPAGVSTEKEPSAKEVGAIVRLARKEGIKAVFVENMTDPRLVEQLAKEAGAVVGGTLYSDALSQPGGPADSYEKMFRHNVAQLRDGMARN